MKFVTKDIKPTEKDRKANLRQLQQNKDNDNSILSKLDELIKFAENKQVQKEANTGDLFERNPIGSKVNNFMNNLINDKNTKEFYSDRDIHGRKIIKKPTNERDLNGCKVKGA